MGAWQRVAPLVWSWWWVPQGRQPATRAPKSVWLAPGGILLHEEHESLWLATCNPFFEIFIFTVTDVAVLLQGIIPLLSFNPPRRPPIPN